MKINIEMDLDKLIFPCAEVMLTALEDSLLAHKDEGFPFSTRDFGNITTASNAIIGRWEIKD